MSGDEGSTSIPTSVVVHVPQVSRTNGRWTPRPDSPASWVVAGACFIITFVTFGLMRCYGIIYVSVLHVFHVTRQEASWPFSVSSAMMNLTGPLAGFLNTKFGTRRMVIAGTTMAAFGASICYVAPNVTFVTVAFGVVQGLGAGLVMLQVPVTVNQYFLKYRTTAQGVAFSGATIATFVYPPIIEYCVETYGLRGTFLIIAGILLHGCIGGALIRTPPWLLKDKPKSPAVNNHQQNHIHNHHDIMKNHHNSKTKESLFLNSDSCVEEDNSKKILLNQYRYLHQMDFNFNEDSRRESYTDSYNKSPDRSSRLDDSDRWSSSRESWRSHHHSSMIQLDSARYKSNGFATMDPTESLLSLATSDESEPIRTKIVINIPKESPSDLMPPFRLYNQPSLAMVSSMDSIAIAAPPIQTTTSTITVVKNILRHPIFYLITGCWSAFLFGYITYIMVIIDSAVDNGIDEKDAIFIFSSFSMGDIIGRLGLGWVTDKGYVRRKNFVMFMSLTLGLTLMVIPSCWAYAFQLAASVVIGVAVGSNMILFAVLFAEYMKPDHVPMALGLGCFVNGIVSLIRPFLVGFFRDSHGTYDNLYYAIGSVAVFLSFLWLLEPYFMKKFNAKAEELRQNGTVTAT